MPERRLSDKARLYLAELRVAIPFLQEIPNDRYFKLDPSELYLPTGQVQRDRRLLEGVLDHFVMTYRRDVFRLDIAIYRHLCANLRGAILSEEELTILQNYESRYVKEKVSFVAYQKPLELIDPYTTSLAELYREKGLLGK